MTQITPLDFRDNLLGAFRTFWNNRTLVAWPNVEFKPEDVPEDEDAWVEVQIIGASPGQTSIGDSVNSGRNFQRTGTFAVAIYVRGNTATDLAYQLADAVKQFMESPRAVPNTLLRDIDEPRPVGPDGTWWQVNLTCSFVYFTDRG